MNTLVKDKYDLVFIGAGITTAASLLKCLDALISHSSRVSPLSVLVIDLNEELWKGQPYGNRSMPNALTITILEEFVPICQKEEFYKWLNVNKSIWLDKMLNFGGNTAVQWVKTNKNAIDHSQWSNIFLPRFLFGDFLEEKLLNLLVFAESNNLAHVHTLKGEVVDLDRINDNYSLEVLLDNKDKLTVIGRKVFLAVGSPKIKKINNVTGNNAFYLINNTYAPSIASNLETIDQILVLNSENNKIGNILLVGSNASSIEFLYLINSYKKISQNLSKIVVMSPSGRLPNRISHDVIEVYEFENLTGLLSSDNLSPSVLFETIKIDLDIAYGKGIRLGDLYYQINDLVVRLLNKLTDHEKQLFHCQYGMIYSKIIRRSGADYSNAVDNLFDADKLEVVKGAFQYLTLTDNLRSTVKAAYIDEKTNLQVTEDSFSIVINCGGFEDLHHSSSQLLANLINKGICKVNCTNKGIVVNEDFEAHDNFYVIGPLLGGIFNDKVRLWHVENAKSIFKIATLMTECFFK